MMDWQTSNELPDMLVRTRQFVSTKRWWSVSIWNGLEGRDSKEWHYVGTATNEAAAIRKAAKAIRSTQ